MKKINYSHFTLFLCTLLFFASCKDQNINSDLKITYPVYNSPNDIQIFESSFTEIIQAEKFNLKSIGKTGIENKKRFAYNVIIVELINPKMVSVSDETISEQLNLIKEKALKHIENINKIDEITLVLKWTENDIERKKSVKI